MGLASFGVVAFSGAKSITNWHGQADVYALSIETARSLTARTEVGAYVAPQVVWQPRSWYGYRFGNGNEKVRAIGAGGLIRHRRGRFFVELSAGPLWSEKQVPAIERVLFCVTTLSMM